MIWMRWNEFVKEWDTFKHFFFMCRDTLRNFVLQPGIYILVLHIVKQKYEEDLSVADIFSLCTDLWKIVDTT